MTDHDYIRDGNAIYERSFAIVREEADADVEAIRLAIHPPAADEVFILQGHVSDTIGYSGGIYMSVGTTKCWPSRLLRSSQVMWTRLRPVTVAIRQR